MELQFEITNAGTLGSRWTPPGNKDLLPCTEPRWQHLLQEDDGMIGATMLSHFMSAEFARLKPSERESDTDALP